MRFDLDHTLSILRTRMCPEPLSNLRHSDTMNNMQAQQFAALQKATTVFHNETKTADHMRRREADLMNREQEQQRRLEEELRVAHGAVGEETRTQKNLEVERKRYRQATEADRQANVKITSELKGIEADEKEQKTQFVKEMDSLNNESDVLLTQRENKKTTLLLDADEVNWLVETKINAFANRSGGVDELQAAEDTEKWSELATHVKEELAGLIDTEEKGDGAMKESNELEQFLEQLRAKFSSENGNIGQMEISDLEAKWEQHYECNYQEEQGDENGMEVDGGKAGNTLSGVADGSSPIHMQMFYGNQEYSGPVYDANSANNIGHAC